MSLFDMFRPKHEDGMSGQKLVDELVASKEQQQAFREPQRDQAAAAQDARVTELKAAADAQYSTPEASPAAATQEPETPENTQQAA